MWVTPRSKARRSTACWVSRGLVSPKLCHNPSEIAGSFRPLRPLRRYCIPSYRSGAGTYAGTPAGKLWEVIVGPLVLSITGDLTRACETRLQQFDESRTIEACSKFIEHCGVVGCTGRGQRSV